MPEVSEVTDFVVDRGISRITHFTNSRNLPGILEAGAILPTSQLIVDGVVHANTDPERWDGHMQHICCSVEYPNAYYFQKAKTRSNHVNFTDWMVLLLAPEILSGEGVLFAPANAAVANGSTLREGVEGIRRQYAPLVRGNIRTDAHRRPSPTDVQAEVLVPGRIELSAVKGIVVPTSAALRRELVRLPLQGLDAEQFDWFVSPDMFVGPAVARVVQGRADMALAGPFRSVSEVVE